MFTFKPTGYFLDEPKVLSLAFIRDSNDAHSEVSITLGDVLTESAAWTVRSVNTGFADNHEPNDTITISTDAGNTVLRGEWFNCRLLEILLELRNAGGDPLHATWYWYDSEYSTDDPQEAYDFFVVSKLRIVRETVTLFDNLLEKGFSASLFQNIDDIPTGWSQEESTREAEKRFWYRKFYRETYAGQLMMLRPDEPELFHYPEGERERQASADRTTDDDGDDDSESRIGINEQVLRELSTIQVTLNKIQGALWVLVGISVLWMLFFRR